MHDDPADAAGRWCAGRIRAAVGARGEAVVAVSGGTSAPALFVALLERDVPWESVTVWQVDERVAPDGDPARNAEQLGDLPCRVRLMPVTEADLSTAARRYGATLPPRFDVVHLGLGADGHTASWPPGDAVVDSGDLCEVIGAFNGHRRMTLTPRAVNAARARMVLAYGASKAPVVDQWLRGGSPLPVERVRRAGTWAFLDRSAATRLPSGRSQ